MVTIGGVGCKKWVVQEDLVGWILILFPADLLTWYCLCKYTLFSESVWLQKTPGSRAQKLSCTAASRREKTGWMEQWMQYAGSQTNRRTILFWVPVVCGEGSLPQREKEKRPWEGGNCPAPIEGKRKKKKKKLRDQSQALQTLLQLKHKTALTHFLLGHLVVLLTLPRKN